VEWYLDRLWGRIFCVSAFLDVFYTLLDADITDGLYGSDYIETSEFSTVAIEVVLSVAPLDYITVQLLVALLVVLYFFAAFIGGVFIFLVIKDPLRFALLLEKYNGRI
jgi:hypothetical protein